MPRYIGKEMSRVDGVAKVTGKAKYAAEFQVPNLAYGFIVTGHDRQGHDHGDRHAGGRSRCRRDPRLHAPEHAEARAEGSTEEAPPRGNREEQDKSFRALQSDRIFFNGQPVALVVAETYEQARYAARLVKVTYNAEKHDDRHRGGARAARECRRRGRRRSRAATRRRRCGARR